MEIKEANYSCTVNLWVSVHDSRENNTREFISNPAIKWNGPSTVI